MGSWTDGLNTDSGSETSLNDLNTNSPSRPDHGFSYTNPDSAGTRDGKYIEDSLDEKKKRRYPPPSKDRRRSEDSEQPNLNQELTPNSYDGIPGRPDFNFSGIEPTADYSRPNVTPPGGNDATSYPEGIHEEDREYYHSGINSGNRVHPYDDGIGNYKDLTMKNFDIDSQKREEEIKNKVRTITPSSSMLLPNIFKKYDKVNVKLSEKIPIYRSKCRHGLSISDCDVCDNKALEEQRKREIDYQKKSNPGVIGDNTTDKDGGIPGTDGENYSLAPIGKIDHDAYGTPLVPSVNPNSGHDDKVNLTDDISSDPNKESDFLKKERDSNKVVYRKRKVDDKNYFMGYNSGDSYGQEGTGEFIGTPGCPAFSGIENTNSLSQRVKIAMNKENIRPPEFPLVRVIWEDVVDIDRVSMDEDFEDKRLWKCETGYMVKRNNEYIIIVSDFDLSGGGDNYGTLIPLGTVVNIEEL